MHIIKVMLCFAFSLLFSTSLLFSQDLYQTPFLKTMVSVENSSSGTFFVPHVVAEGQSLYSLSQFFHATLYDIKRINPELKVDQVKVGDLVKIPIDKEYIITDLSKPTPHAYLDKLYYKVKKGDTPYGIAKRTFSIEVAELLDRNGISEKEVTVGRYLHVGWIPTIGLNYYSKPVKVKAVYYSPENEALRNEFTSKGASLEPEIVNEKGAAFWDKSAGEDFDYYVMHRSAPRNSIIEITNPDTGRTIYTKVLGKIPLKYPNKVIIVVSPKVAKQLGAVNANFFVSLTYHK